VRVLIYGGTRFIGKKVVDNLLASGHQVTLISRREASPHPQLNSIKTERENSYECLGDMHFDCILDFMAYDVKAVEAAVSLMPETPYIFISTAWIDVYKTGARRFLSFEDSYVRRKIEAEAFLEKVHQHGRKVIICRLPITLGADDHSERFKFYTTRLLTNKGLILPGGAACKTRIAFRDDVAAALSALVTRYDICDALIYEALPDTEISLAEWVGFMAKRLGVEANLVNLEPDFIEGAFPEYLDMEPLWREGSYSLSHPNLFEMMKVPVTGYREWISVLCELPEMTSQTGKNTFLQPDVLLREQEFLKRL